MKLFFFRITLNSTSIQVVMEQRDGDKGRQVFREDITRPMQAGDDQFSLIMEAGEKAGIELEGLDWSCANVHVRWS